MGKKFIYLLLLATAFCTGCFNDGSSNYELPATNSFCYTCGGDGLVTCPQCGGNGFVIFNGYFVNCPTCSGSGEVRCSACGGGGTVSFKGGSNSDGYIPDGTITLTRVISGQRDTFKKYKKGNCTYVLQGYYIKVNGVNQVSINGINYYGI